MLAYVETLRPANSLMAAVAVIIGGLIVIKGISQDLMLAALAAFLITCAGNAINDYTDVESDRINRPKRPIPSGRVSARSVLAFSIILFAAGIAVSGLVNWVVFAIAVFNSLILVLYSFHLQNKLLIGNVAISYLVGSAFLFGGAAVDNVVLPALLGLLAGFSNIGREITKDLQDIEGDKAGFLKRLAKAGTAIVERFGIAGRKPKLKHKTRLLTMAALSLALAVTVSPAPYILGMLRLPYLIVLVPTNLAFVYAIYLLARGRGRASYSRISKAIKLGMLLGLVAFLAGALL